MDITYIEHQTAPRLEQDIHNFFTQVRFGSPIPPMTHDEHIQKIIEQTAQVLLEYFREWNELMFHHRDSDCSFWVTQFRNAYFTVLQQIDSRQHYFNPTAKHTAKWLAEHILSKLKLLFVTTGFHETLNQTNEQYEKRVNHLRDLYCEVSKLSVDAPDLKFYLSYPAGTELLLSVDQVIQSFREFEKKLTFLPWFRSQVIFSYYHLIRDTTRNCYVIRFYLTFQTVFYSDDIDYSIDLLRLWQDVTYGMGILFDIPDEEVQKPQGNPFGYNPDGLLNFPEPKNPLDDLSDLPDTLTSVNEQMNKICITTRGFKIFNGKKR
ncbi:MULTISPECIES: hypothetical protein [unclassified Acinetobacter]|uniref:hypothetical protein n=1 Tax=unclassified Acinetobacter TaxID=196816 RepID=UPI0015D2A716|nr:MULTISPECIES: hypothetical protein [unclassified Acinetobacter]UUS64550.1 hypothetical protein MST18_11930 [Acinetobacter sp. YH12068_T]